MPEYFLSGRHDLTANYDLAKDFFAQIKAPNKGFYTFQNSAHSPAFAEPLRVRTILTQDVFQQAVRLAD